MIRRVQMLYSVSVKQAANEIKSITGKLRKKQTLADKKNLQQFVETQIQGGKLQQSLQRTAKYDKSYEEFLDDFKKKHSKYSNILDMSHYNHSPLNKQQHLREEELRQIKEFQEKKRIGAFTNIDSIDFINYQQELLEEDDFALDRSQAKDQIIFNRTGFKIEDDFFTIILDRDYNTQVTTLNRINTFRQLIFTGNANGVVGYGFGKGKDFEDALINAFKDSKKNLVPISLDIWHSCPTDLYGKFYDYEITIRSRPRGMNAYGNPQIAAMLMMTGITHCGFKVQSKNQVPYAMVYAFMKAVTQNMTVEEISEQNGIKVYRQYWGKKISKLQPMNLDGI